MLFRIYISNELITLTFFFYKLYMDRKYLWSDPNSFSKIAGPDGKYLHWVTDKADELPLIIGTTDLTEIPPKTFNEVFDDALATHRSTPALQYKVQNKWVIWTYEDYYNDSKKFASSLVNLRLDVKTCINIIGFNSPQWIIGFAGALLASCIPVGVYATNNSEACEYIAAHSEAELILVQNENQLKKYLHIWHRCPKIKAIVVYWPGKELETVRKGKTNIFTFDEFLTMNKPEDVKEVENRLRNIRPTQCATIVYTSGTTGPPKGVLLSHDNCTWTPKSLILTSRLLSDEERLVSYLPLSHIAAQHIDIFGAVYSKACVTFADENALQGSLGITLKETRPTFFFGVPRVFEKIEEKIRAIGASKTGIQKSIADWAKRVGFENALNALTNQSTSFSFSVANKFIFTRIREGIGLDQAKIIIVSAAPISKACLDYFLSLNIPILNLYGMSESTGPASTNTDKNLNFYSVGPKILGTDLVIKGSKGEILPAGVKGEICFKGRNKFMGYYKNEKATKETIDSDGFIHSGDEGMLDKDGFLFVTGRFKELIITAGGENIPPVLIEDAVKAKSKIISNAFLLGEGKKFLSMLITLKTMPNPDGTFSNELTPEVITFVQELGITAKTVEELIAHPQFTMYIDDIIALVNKESTSRAQEIRRYRILITDFSIAGGELTPTMKTKRKFVVEKYSSLVDDIYSDPKI